MAAAPVVDIHGPWQFRANGSTTDPVEVVQVGDAISFSYQGFAISGTLDAAGRLRGQGGSGGLTRFFNGDFSPDGQLLNAGTITLSGFSAIGMSTVLGMRCGCVDGNSTSGDGCDAECQVEPCWVCSGTPSVCVPASDGNACDRALA